MEDNEIPDFLGCSFCGKGNNEVFKLIAGPQVYICDECITLCNEIIREEKKNAAKTESETVFIDMSRDEALVLFEWISRFNELEDRHLEDQAEERVLWNIEADLEKLLFIQLTASNFDELLNKARDRVRDPQERKNARWRH